MKKDLRKHKSNLGALWIKTKNQMQNLTRINKVVIED